MAANFLGSLCFIGATVWAGAADLLTLRIRNGLNLFLVASYVLFAPMSGIGWVEIALSIAVAIGVLTGMFMLFACGWIGGGDAKFTAAIALWLGPDQALAYVLLTAFFGGLLTIALMKFRLTPLPAPCLTMPWIIRLHAPETGVPYGVALAAAALFIFPSTHWMKALI